jgi:hypothetical protein
MIREMNHSAFVSLLGNSTDDLIMSGRGAGAPHISFSLSQNAGLSWKETTVLTAIDSPGCQSPVTGTYGGTGAFITSPVGKTRGNFQLFHATASSGFTDWSSVGTLWDGQAGYSSLLGATSGLLPAGLGCLRVFFV